MTKSLIAEKCTCNISIFVGQKSEHSLTGFFIQASTKLQLGYQPAYLLFWSLLWGEKNKSVSMFPCISGGIHLLVVLGLSPLSSYWLLAGSSSHLPEAVRVSLHVVLSQSDSLFKARERGLSLRSAMMDSHIIPPTHGRDIPLPLPYNVTKSRK